MDSFKETLARAITLQEAGKAEEALPLYQTLLRQHGNMGDLHYLVGLAYQDLKQWQAAYDALRQAVALDAERVDFQMAIGLTFQELEQPEQAKQAYSRAIGLNPDDFHAYYRLGDSHIDLGQPDQAISAFTRAIKLKPDFHEAWINLGLCLKAIGQMEAALKTFRAAIQLAPEDPKAKVDYAMTLLATGDFENGWKHYTERFKFKHVFNDMKRIPANIPAWGGCDLTDQVLLVLCEQGYGDNLQFARYLPQLKQLGVKKLIVESKNRLINLFRYNELADEYCNVLDVQKVQADYYVPLLELPRLLGTRVETIPTDLPTFKVSPEFLQHLAPHTQHGLFKVGLIWTGKPLHARDPARRRSCPFELLAPLAKVQGATFYSLQTGLLDEEVPTHLDAETPLIDLSKILGHFHETAAAMQQMDLIISIDTASAHLAGGLNCPTWLLTPYSADWRWGLQGPSTPWYPQMRLFRQPTPGAWQPVIEQVATALEETIQEGR
ncbi:tetratricopeptide repeat protein [Magnetococcus sp. PR-3]|uniref:tetratricopeptide repeat protein n=1 Tax=Magnetococcus sp. PR-3 TaxID=3120355 RepID=UPI002FCE5F6C